MSHLFSRAFSISSLSSRILRTGLCLGLGLTGCSNQAEGERCDLASGSADCDSGLQCVQLNDSTIKEAICCPVSDPTTEACQANAYATPSDSADAATPSASAAPSTPADAAVVSPGPDAQSPSDAQAPSDTGIAPDSASSSDAEVQTDAAQTDANTSDAQMSEIDAASNSSADASDPLVDAQVEAGGDQ